MDTISLFSSFMKMIFALAIVLGLLIGVMYFVKKFMQQTGPATNSQDLINIISSKYLGPKNSIVLIEVLDQLIVVGISNQQMTTLACIDDPQAVAKIKTERPNVKNINFPGSKLAKYIAQFSQTAGRQKDKSTK
jgi:flagellar biosynthetic protein FliO